MGQATLDKSRLLTNSDSDMQRRRGLLLREVARRRFLESGGTVGFIRGALRPRRPNRKGGEMDASPIVSDNHHAVEGRDASLPPEKLAHAYGAGGKNKPREEFD